MTTRYPLPDLAATRQLAAMLAPLLKSGDALLLRGDLGAGKTTFARFLLQELGLQGEAPSPTFTLAQTYELPALVVSHLDLYRLKRPEEIEELGLDELLADGAALIEWPEMAASYMPRDALTLSFDCPSDGARAVSISAPPSWEPRLAGVLSALTGPCEDETELRVSFLSQAGWGGAAPTPIAADWSVRRFFRIARPNGQTAILMHAAPDQRTKAFVRLSPALRACGVAAPEIYASDLSTDLVLMEDFGPTTVGALLDQGQDRAPFDWEAATLLARLHERFTADLLGDLQVPSYDAACFAEQAAFYIDHALPARRGGSVSAEERAAFVSAWRAVLSPLDALPRTLMLRDFMPDNLMALPSPVLGQSVGLIDYQDAGLGPAAYDLASWCEVVRRDGGSERLTSVIDAYGPPISNADKEVLYEAARLLSAQRHMRILGRLVALKRPHLAARVVGTLRALSGIPALAPLSPWLSEIEG